MANNTVLIFESHKNTEGEYECTPYAEIDKNIVMEMVEMQETSEELVMDEHEDHTLFDEGYHWNQTGEVPEYIQQLQQEMKQEAERIHQQFIEMNKKLSAKMAGNIK